MDLPGTEDTSIAELIEEDPRGAFVGLQLIFRQIDDDEAVDGVLLIARKVAQEEGVNLFRAMREHGEHTREIFGIEPEALDDDLVARVDAVME